MSEKRTEKFETFPEKSKGVLSGRGAAIATALGIALSGCAAADYETDHRFTPATLMTPSDLGKIVMKSDWKQDPTTHKYPNDAEVDVAFQNVPAADRAAIQKTYFYYLLDQSDVLCDTYLRRLKGRNSFITYGLGVSGLALSAASSVATPIRSAQLLAGLSGLAVASSSEIEKDVLNNSHFDLIYNANMKGRASLRTSLVASFATNYAGAPLSSVRALVENYNRQCGLSYGIDYISTQVSNSATINGAGGVNGAAAVTPLGGGGAAAPVVPTPPVDPPAPVVPTPPVVPAVPATPAPPPAGHPGTLE